MNFSRNPVKSVVFSCGRWEIELFEWLVDDAYQTRKCDRVKVG